MASIKQIEANRANAANSTGPTSATGKLSSSKNAMKHGLLSEETLITGEDKSAFDKLSTCMMESLRPIGTNEEMLADRIIAYTWRLRRVFKIEALFLDVSNARLGENDVFGEMTMADRFRLYPTGIGTLNRYEVSIEKMLNRALHELQRVQAQRTGHGFAVPHAIDF